MAMGSTKQFVSLYLGINFYDTRIPPIDDWTTLSMFLDSFYEILIYEQILVVLMEGLFFNLAAFNFL